MIKDLKPIRLDKYAGRNSFSEITNLGPQEFRSITNTDIFSGMAGDYLKSRRGSSLLVPDGEAQTMPFLSNKVVFPVLGSEYLILSQPFSGEFYSVLLPGNPVLINGGVLEISGDDGSQFSNLSLFGISSDNSDNLTLYWTLTYEENVTLNIYKDSGLTQLVAMGLIGFGSLPGTISIAEVDSSGISGSVDVVTGTDESGSFQYNAFSITADGNDPDMKVYNDRIYVFHQSGNKIIYWDAIQGRMVGRPMGLSAPVFIEFDVTTGDILPSATYVYGIEKVIQRDGSDYVASSPNRKWADGKIRQLRTDTGGIILFVSADWISDDPYWTHVRLWRSKTLTADFSDPLSPIDAQGTQDQLYEVALITRTELMGVFGPIDTSNTLPPGNAKVSAGTGGGNFEISDGNNDSVLVNVIDLDLIGLIPLPGCRTGTVNKGRIWSAGIGSDFLAPNGPSIDPTIREDALYTTEQFSQYQEQWDPQAYLVAGRDGKETSALQTFLEDVIVIRQDMTKRVPNGNPDSGIVMVDDKIGVPSFRMTGFIPQIGVCAICSDAYFRYFGFDLTWHQYLGKVEVSQSIYDLTLPVIDQDRADFVYMNGKLLMLLPGGNVASLGVKESKGWSLYRYPSLNAIAFNFASGFRAAIGVSNQYLLEIETTAEQDANQGSLDGPLFDVTWSFETYGFSGQGGIFEPTRYSFWGKLKQICSVTAKSSNQTWEMQSTFIDPGVFASNPDLNEREYIYEPKPIDVVPYKWLPLRGQFISFVLSGTGTAMISWQQVIARLRITSGNLGVFPDGGIVPQGPYWAGNDLSLLNFEDPAETFYDASGGSVNLFWADVGTKTNRVAQKPGKGLQMAGGGYASRDTDPISPLIGGKNMAFKAVFSLSTGGQMVFSGNAGSNFFVLDVESNKVTMTLSNGNSTFSYTSSFSFSVGTVYALMFVIFKDLTGQFYFDALNASTFFGKRTTTRAIPSSTTPAPYGPSSNLFTNLVLGGSYANQPLYGTLSQTFQFWKLYSNATDRDNGVNPVGYFAGPPSGDTYSFFPLNGSGITGSVDSPDPSYPVDPQYLDVALSFPIPPAGQKLLIDGTISYLEVLKSDPGPQQAQQFWRMIRNY